MLNKTFFFDICDEFKIDNIYIRIFNKEPSYNIGKNLILFLKHVIRNSFDCLKTFTLLNFYFDNMNTKAHVRLGELVRQKLCASLTAICMIIEQINFSKSFNTIYFELNRF